MGLLSFLFLALVIAGTVRLFEPAAPPPPLSPIPTPPSDPETNSLEDRIFSWENNSISKSLILSFIMQIRTSSYKTASNELLSSTPSKVYMISDKEYFEIARHEILHSDFGAFNYELEQVAGYLMDVADEEMLSDIEFAGLVLSFTQEQCIPYGYDKDTTGYQEYLRFPIETIYDLTGDCDCKAILACALFKTLGFHVAFALMPGHAALLISLPEDEMPFANFVWKGKRWYYCETTGDNWFPGQLPSGIEKDEIEPQEI
jgi:hypothetical protein